MIVQNTVRNGGPGRLSRVRFGLLSMCLVAVGCRAAVDRHTDYFEKMANRMPKAGQLRMHSQVGGMSAAYVGPGRAGSCAARLVRAHYADGKLSLCFDCPVHISEAIPLSLAAVLIDEKKNPVPVSDQFDSDTEVPATTGYQRVLTFSAPRKQSALSGKYRISLKGICFATCGGHDITGDAELELPSASGT
ncbi:MAG: hypothetical protein IH987_02735 [Planctomycetes bacterium]|nr:hypothetical protein [Planctomycetota bacterium]